MKIIRENENGKVVSIIFDDRYEIKGSDGIVWNARFKNQIQKDYPSYLDDKVIKRIIKAIWKN